MSIRARLLLLVLVTGMIPVALVALRYYEVRESAIAAAIRSQQRTAQSIATDLEARIQGTAQLQFGLARSRDLDNPTREGCSAFLSDVRQRQPQYTGILTIDPGGQLFCDSLHTGRTLDLRDRAYFQRARDTTDKVVLEPAFGRLTGIAVLQIAYPVRDAANALQYVLLASLNLAQVADAAAAGRVQGTEVLLLDAKGTVLAWTTSRGNDRRPLPSPRVGTPIADTDLFRFAHAGAEPANGTSTELVGLDGTRQVWVKAESAQLREAGLIALVGRAHSDLVAAPDKRLLEDLLTLVGFTLLLLGGTWFLVEFAIRRPLGRIAGMAARLGGGDLGARLPPPYPSGELGSLMAVLNESAASLDRNRRDIDELNQKLRQSQRLEAIGQMTGGIAHDFNNLLTVIIGSTDLLEESLAKDPSNRGLATMARDAALRGAELTGRLLAFARRQALDPRAIDVNALVAAMDALLRRALGEHIEIRTILEPQLRRALIDPGQLESAILNLGVNARDAMPDGGRLTIETANADLDEDYAAGQPNLLPGSYVMIAISDTGTGMDQATLARAFDPFFTTKEAGKGSGLGLSMVHGFINQSRGHVRIYSEPGLGTTVKLYLPCAGAEDAPSASPGPLAEGIVGGSERILVVEDDEPVRQQVEGQLRRMGYAVVSAATGAEALRLLDDGQRFDLLFTDVVMPGGLNGPQLAEQAVTRQPGLAVLFTSGYTENAIVHGGRLDRGVHLLNKPYRRQDLAAKVRAVLDERRPVPPRG
ncbi:ATP-binding protein [Zavarzinia sp. CC-PAN008]|uniref:ATP-binding protein n=1 Tax=Zavarzinia sp. CC-PAN008 TaxID=3243332 RepID=UPI003F74425C